MAEVKELKDFALANCPNIEKITIPDHPIVSELAFFKDIR